MALEATPITLEERFKGCLLGLACGDAVGTTTEFLKAGSFEEVKGRMIGGGVFSLLPGQFTDDTSMALCLAESILFSVNPMDVYLKWYRNGHLSSNGRCFDIGKKTRSSLENFERGKEQKEEEKGEEKINGNGSLMRLCPVVLANFEPNNPEIAIKAAAESSKVTHPAKNAVDSCRLLASLIIGALSGESKETILDYASKAKLWERESLVYQVELIAQGSYKAKKSDEICNSGVAHIALEAALWAFYTTNSFEEGVLALTNKGDDSDTTSAIYGQLAGAFYGIKSIPEEWKSKISFGKFIEKIAVELLQISQVKSSTCSQEMKSLFSILSILEEGYSKIRRKLSPGPGPPTVWPGGFQSIEQFDEAVKNLIVLPFQQSNELSKINEEAAQSLLVGFTKQLSEDKIKLSDAFGRRPAVTNLMNQIRLKQKL